MFFHYILLLGSIKKENVNGRQIITQKGEKQEILQGSSLRDLHSKERIE